VKVLSNFDKERSRDGKGWGVIKFNTNLLLKKRKELFS
jgi:hypothetical protein